MRKMRLDVDELTVESFETIAVGNQQGTVRAQEQETWMTCFQDYSCPALSCQTQCAERCTPEWSEGGCEFETANSCETMCTCFGATCEPPYCVP